MIKSIRDTILALFMLGWEILLILIACKRYDSNLGLFHQTTEYYILVTALCIFTVVFDIHVDRSQRRIDTL
jgi:hypothetical protein